jgi:hypothetical protein
LGIFGVSNSMGPRYWEVKPFITTKNRKNSANTPRALSLNHNTRMETFLWKKIMQMSIPSLNVKVTFYD